MYFPSPPHISASILPVPLGFVMYNVFVGILQSVGDSRHPLVYLIISSVVNVVLDLFFDPYPAHGGRLRCSCHDHLPVLSAVLCFGKLRRCPEDYRVYINKIRFDRTMFSRIIKNGLPAGFQNSIIAFANVIVQTNINAFGKMAVAGCGAYSKIEGFVFLPINCFTLALTTFVSQNLGAKEYDRAKKWGPGSACSAPC